jgi:hypothetical protein
VSSGLTDLPDEYGLVISRLADQIVARDNAVEQLRTENAELRSQLESRRYTPLTPGEEIWQLTVRVPEGHAGRATNALLSERGIEVIQAQRLSGSG